MVWIQACFQIIREWRGRVDQRGRETSDRKKERKRE